MSHGRAGDNMKRFVFVAALTFWAAAAFPQGTLTFNNTAATVITWGPGWGRSGPVTAADGIKVGLYYYGANGFTLVSPTPFLGTLSTGATNAAMNGRFNYGTLTVAGLPAGQTGTFQLRAWFGPFASYEAAKNGGGVLGWGELWPAFTNPSGGAIDSATGLPGPPASLNLPAGLQIILYPEPSTLALTSLGLGVLLLLRRQRSASNR
jgi:hypothetical protein